MKFFVDSLRNKLSYFMDIEHITKQYHKPSFSVHDDEFLPLLKRIDECLTFLHDNPTFKESETYIMKYKVLQNRALTMIKNHIVSIFKSTTEEILQLVEDSDTTEWKNDFTADSSYYFNVKAKAFDVKTLCREIEIRSHQREYESLLADIHYVYFQQRRELLKDKVDRVLFELCTSNDIFHMVRSGCLYLIEACVAEYNLQKNFFNTISPGLRMLLEGFATTLYDNMRPIIIRCISIDTLCGLIDILRNEIILKEIPKKGDSMEAFKPIINRMIEDIQERLIFQSQRHIRNISNYVPSEMDLNYPEKLMEAKNNHKNEDSEELLQWDIIYPSLEKTLKCLSKLYESIDNISFDGIAQEAINVCMDSLNKAYENLAKTKGNEDAHLFLIMHLSILQQFIIPFDVSFSFEQTSIDMSHVLDAIKNMFNGQKSLFAFSKDNALYSLLMSATPRIKKSEINYKENINTRLEQAKQEYTDIVASSLCQPLSDFLKEYSISLNNPGTENSIDKSEQYYETVKQVNQEFVEAIEPFLNNFVLKMDLYVSQNDIEDNIFHFLRRKIKNRYSKFLEVTKQECNTDIEIREVLELLDEEYNKNL
eukprot:TRINITY_DN1512_c0_g1_i2.p1 TRINITY_DN1512_c0_g1~~TRINITY_DN1512_c0_g1_i2.p1  ORF type:complete len:594 (-),score=114.04 TRINITY_DN1512_c0_g1_i2:6-1787(-)